MDLENLENNANYQELKESTKSILSVVTSNDLYYGIFLLVLAVVILKILDLIFKPLQKTRSLLASFVKGILKVMVIVVFGMRIIALIPGMENFASQILMSSSLIVVVLGFVFQEGLSNIVHGFILSAFRPFVLGDRISVRIDGETITGYVEEITARHTVIRNVLNSAHVIVPNSILDNSMITNNRYSSVKDSSSFIDISVTYDSDIELAMDIISKDIMRHPYVQEYRKQMNVTDPVVVMVRDMSNGAADLRAPVNTLTVEENFAACADIRKWILLDFQKEKQIIISTTQLRMVMTGDPYRDTADWDEDVPFD